ncbi:hypothetical protein [Streptomyces sp. Da 82-17]|uniref:hypothetical protein n=1 Tax=Streptomyces sp. Da 82-17 TaxID=3377116 RepID=UPI0038D39457
MSFSGGHLVLVLLLLLAVRGLFVWGRGAYHRRRLPARTLQPQQVEACQRQAFRELCRRADGPAARVDMNDWFTSQGWNRADALLVLSEPLKPDEVSSCSSPHRPAGLMWAHLDAEKIAAIPVLAARAPSAGR